MLPLPFSGGLSLSLSLYAQLAAVDCDTFLVAPFPEFNDAEDAAGSASVLRNVLFCQRVTDTVIDMLHATCCLYKWLIHFSSGGGTGTKAGARVKALNRPWPTGCSSSARGSVEGGQGAGDPQRLPANATGYNQEHTRTATANGWMSWPGQGWQWLACGSHEWLEWVARWPTGSLARQGLNLSQRTSAAQELVAHDCARCPLRPLSLCLTLLHVSCVQCPLSCARPRRPVPVTWANLSPCRCQFCLLKF